VLSGVPEPPPAFGGPRITPGAPSLSSPVKPTAVQPKPGGAGALRGSGTPPPAFGGPRITPGAPSLSSPVKPQLFGAPLQKPSLSPAVSPTSSSDLPKLNTGAGAPASGQLWQAAFQPAGVASEALAASHAWVRDPWALPSRAGASPASSIFQCPVLSCESECSWSSSPSSQWRWEGPCHGAFAHHACRPAPTALLPRVHPLRKGRPSLQVPLRALPKRLLPASSQPAGRSPSLGAVRLGATPLGAIPVGGTATGVQL